MQIYIPSTHRAGMQYTLDELLSHGVHSRLIRIVVPVDEVDSYVMQHGPQFILACPAKGIAATRQWIMEYATDNHVIMMDDDLTFFTRREDEPAKFRDMEVGELVGMLDSVNESLYDYAHVGIATREGGNRNTGPVIACTRMLRVLSYDREKFFAHKCDFTRNGVVQEDFEVTLQLLTAGEPNLVHNRWVHNQKGSGSAGGCSTYRTMEVQAAAAHSLKSHFPDFVRVVEKTTKTAWGGATRTDVTIYWKKAYEYGLSRCRAQ
jgi:hypothetical protein